MIETRRVLLGGMLLVVVGCADPAEKKAPVATAKAAEGARPGGGARQGGYVVLPSAEPAALNPVLQNAYDLAHPLIFEGLVGIDAAGELVPRLAERWERGSDEKTLTFHLRKGAAWHDGKPFTAADVLFTVEKIRTGDSPWAGYLAPLDTITAPDDHRVVVTFKHPYGLDLAVFTFGVVPKHAFGGEYDRGPIGTGAFRFQRWTPGKEMLLDANPTHWSGRPNLDQIRLVFDKEIAPPKYLAALQESKLDLAAIREIGDWPVLATPEVREKFEVALVDEAQFNVIAWNNKRKPFDDRRVRQAMTHGFDRQRVIEDILKGAARPVSGPFYPTMWGGDATIPPWPFDPARAGALLDEAGKKSAKGGKRFAFELLITEASRGPALDEMLAIFRSDLAKVGVEMKPVYLLREEVVRRLIAGEFDAALYQWAPDVPDPDPFVLVHSSQAGAGNYAGFAHPEVDRLVTEARTTTDRGKRREAYRKVHALVHEEEPYSFLFSPQEYVVWNRRLRGVNPLDVGALPRWPGVAKWWVEN